MYEETMYGPWLKYGTQYRNRYIACLIAGFAGALVLFLIAHLVMKLEIAPSAVIGFVPLMIFYLLAYAYYDKWQECEEMFSHKVPFIDVILKNMVLVSLQFGQDKVTCIVRRHNGYHEKIDIPANVISIVCSEDDSNSLLYRKERNNFTHTESWIYAKICLNPNMQEKMVRLAASESFKNRADQALSEE